MVRAADDDSAPAPAESVHAAGLDPEREIVACAAPGRRSTPRGGRGTLTFDVDVFIRMPDDPLEACQQALKKPPVTVRERVVISQQDVAFYRENGYLVVANVLSGAEIAELRRVTEEFVENARSRTRHDEIYDLEDSHSAAEPRVRRIKTPHQWHESYARIVAHPRILAILQRFWGPSIRFDVSKLNLKAAGYGAPVEWHQDWAFYPHTNDDLAAVGIMLDDVDETNSPLMVLPGSHLGPIFDHHDDGGYFCGAMDPGRSEIDFSTAVKLTGAAGSITIHHARTVHGSATNTSGRPRRLLLHQYRAADAWPLLGTPDFQQYRSLLLCGEDTLVPRLERVPVRLPLPPARNQGSIYENQKSAGRRFFQTADELEPAAGDD